MGKGWTNEPQKHSLASKGVRTTKSNQEDDELIINKDEENSSQEGSFLTKSAIPKRWRRYGSHLQPDDNRDLGYLFEVKLNKGYLPIVVIYIDKSEDYLTTTVDVHHSGNDDVFETLTEELDDKIHGTPEECKNNLIEIMTDVEGEYEENKSSHLTSFKEEIKNGDI